MGSGDGRDGSPQLFLKGNSSRVAILLVRCCQTIAAHSVCVFVRSWFSHIAMVVRNPSKQLCDQFQLNQTNQSRDSSEWQPEQEADGLYVLESDVPHVTLMPLSEWIKIYDLPQARRW